MKKERKTTKKKKKTSLLMHVVKSPYYLGKLLYVMNKTANKKTEKRSIAEKRSKMPHEYEEFGIISTISGDFNNWKEDIMSADSKIGIILGARGSGKTAFGIKLLENIYSKTKRKCCAMGFKEESMPHWINVIEGIDKIPNNSVILIDEGGILFNARKSMSEANKLLSDLILISRHKNLTILFISQNSSNLDVNIIRQADFLVLKNTSLLQKDFERKKIQKIYEEIEAEFKDHRENKGAAHIYSDKFRGFVSVPLPSFWSVKISKSFGQ